MHIRFVFLALIAFSLNGCADPGMARDLSPAGNSAGQKLYVAKCAKCHKFYDPAKYSDADWEMWMTKMGKKAKLKPDQQEDVSRYIAENLRNPKSRTNSISIVK